MRDPNELLTGLKDFQRRTVEHVFRRMYLDEHPARRFLVADEVGLGKTLVARGLIAMITEHLRNKGVKRIDVIYVCSNADIARQNVERLNSSGRPAFVQSRRLTLLPLSMGDLTSNELNFISFTPGTTFDYGQRTGTKEERRLIYQMLHPKADVSRRGLVRLLQANAGQGWFQEAEVPVTFDAAIADKFYRALRTVPAVCAELEEICVIFHDRRRTPSAEQVLRGQRLVGELRRLLAKSCLAALEPDLVILDEFQRFKDLLGDPGGNPVAELAHDLFNYPNPDLRILLLSATPYKMFARDDEEENHHQDFLQTIGFLMDDDEHLSHLKEDLSVFRRCLQAVGGELEHARIDEIKAKVELRLRQVMCRTERVGATSRLDAMVSEQRPALPLAAKDLADLRMADALSRELGDRDTLEFWKSCPYLLNFMKDYTLKRKLRGRIEQGGKHAVGVHEILRSHPGSLLPKKSIAAYEPLEPANARLRLLVQETIDSGLWRLLWLPPSLPYWRPAGAYAEVHGATKTLVFSGWHMVPDAIAAVLSYEVERRMVQESGKKSTYAVSSKAFPAALRFSGDPNKPQLAFLNHPSHMTLALLFPSAALAALVDPLETACTERVDKSWDKALEMASRRIRGALERFLPKNTGGAEVDENWYWRAIILLERAYGAGGRDWCAGSWSAALIRQDAEREDEPAGFERFLQSWLLTWDGYDFSTGRPPDDLCDVIASIALAGPAVCAQRAMRRASPELEPADVNLRSAAARVAVGLRSLFNSPEAVALVGGTEKAGTYWRRVLAYCASGNLQAVLDEQVHVLRESLGLFDTVAGETAQRIAEELHTALSIRTATLRPDEIRVGTDDVGIGNFPVRCHYALRFGEMRDEETVVARKETVRTAFNSPFRPFVLASTSVGQEGLDFHVWCHSLIHWNLPSNPVDLEQREGRVHRYKGHAVRKNVARAFGLDFLSQALRLDEDPWRVIFEAARAGRGVGCTDLIPFWLYETEGGACVERRILAMPYSRDEGRYRRLQRSLALYRMVFGQPRQEDLLEYLMRQFSPDEAERIAKHWKISLEPPYVMPRDDQE